MGLFLMDLLKRNIINLYGKKGRDWINNLPIIIAELSRYWELSHIMPVDNMTFNYVVKAITTTNQPVVLKISCDEKSISDEIQALNYFDGNGSVRLIAHYPAYHALLLQQAIPGITLKSLYPSQIEYVMDAYIDTMRKLHNKQLVNKNSYRHISNWLSVIDSLSEDVCPLHLIRKAITLKNELLASMKSEIFLHGDLHHDNILKDGDQWLAIDPKGIIGEPAFEIAAFDFMYVNELANKMDVKNIFEARVCQLANKAKLDAQRIKKWIFVRLMLMAAWYIEDNGDPTWAITLANAVD